VIKRLPTNRKDRNANNTDKELKKPFTRAILGPPFKAMIAVAFREQ